MIRQLVFIRHAHRDNSVRGLDNGLTAKGEKQARRLRRFAESRFDRDEWRDLKGALLSSPKRRCAETLAGVADHFETPVQRRADLDEQKSGESFADFNDRIQKFLFWWTRHGAPVTMVCSHGDWLPLAVFHLLGVPVEMKKGAWLELEWNDGLIDLRWYVPGFRIFYGD